MLSTMARNKPRIRLWALLFWLILWQGLAMLVGHDFLLASPLESAARFAELALTAAFWRSALYTLCRILTGFVLGLAAGAICAFGAARLPRLRELIAPMWAVLRAIPVASFVIVALIWVPSRRLSVLIVFLIVFPVVYAGILSEIERADSKLIEMARVMRMPLRRRLTYIYILPALDGLNSLCATAMGLAWKSGIAAELISIPSGSIGERLYTAKVYLMTGDLFAWTALIVLLSALCARLFTRLLRAGAALLERM